MNVSPLSSITDAILINQRKEHKFLCANGECKAELILFMTDKQFNNRFFFNKDLYCVVCGLGKMYEVK